MIKLNDIYHKMNTNLIENDYLNADIETKKKIIDEELREYICDKICETNHILTSKEIDSLTTIELVQILGNQIPKEQHDTTLSHLTHSILSIASNLQLYAIVWYQENDETLISEPKIEINDEKWDALKTHKDTSYVQAFAATYDVFQNHFMKSSNKQLKLTDKNNL